MPGWGLSVLLPQAIGVRRAREMSFTGNFMDANEAYEYGLVNHVVPHAELIPFTRKIALDIIGNEQSGVQTIRNTYSLTTTDAAAWTAEAAEAKAWLKRSFSADAVAERRDNIMQRGRQQ